MSNDQTTLIKALDKMGIITTVRNSNRATSEWSHVCIDDTADDQAVVFVFENGKFAYIDLPDKE